MIKLDVSQLDIYAGKSEKKSFCKKNIKKINALEQRADKLGRKSDKLQAEANKLKLETGPGCPLFFLNR